MLATRSLSYLQTCQALQKVVSIVLNLSVFVSESFALGALCSCIACQCDGCFGCSKQCTRRPSDKQFYAETSNIA